MAAGLLLAIVTAAQAPVTAAFGAVLAAGAAAVLVLRGAVEALAPAPPARVDSELPLPGEPLRSFRDPFARREVYDTIAQLTIRNFGSAGWPYDRPAAERICQLPPTEFRAWANERLARLEEST